MAKLSLLKISGHLAVEVLLTWCKLLEVAVDSAPRGERVSLIPNGYADMPGVIGTLSWVVLGIGLVFLCTGALSGLALLGGGTFMIDDFLATSLTMAALADVFQFFLAPGVGFFFLRVSIGIL